MLQLKSFKIIYILAFFFFFFSFFFFPATPESYGNSWARDRIGAACSWFLHPSQGNTGPEPHLHCLHCSLQQCQILNPLEQGQGSNLHPHGYQLDWFPLSHDGNSWTQSFLLVTSDVDKPQAGTLPKGRYEWYKKDEQQQYLEYKIWSSSCGSMVKDQTLSP